MFYCENEEEICTILTNFNWLEMHAQVNFRPSLIYFFFSHYYFVWFRIKFKLKHFLTLEEIKKCPTVWNYKVFVNKLCLDIGFFFSFLSKPTRTITLLIIRMYINSLKRVITRFHFISIWEWELKSPFPEWVTQISAKLKFLVPIFCWAYRASN